MYIKKEEINQAINLKNFCRSVNSSLPLPYTTEDLWFLKRFLSSSGVSDERFPTDARLTKTGHIVDQNGSLLSADIYGRSTPETYLAKTVAILLTHIPESGTLVSKLCAINKQEHYNQSKFYIFQFSNFILIASFLLKSN